MIHRKTGSMVLAGAVMFIAGVIVTIMLLISRPAIIHINLGTFNIIELPHTYMRYYASVLVVGSAIGGLMLGYILTMLFSTGGSDVKSNINVEEKIKIPAHASTVSTYENPVKEDMRLVEAVLTALEGDEKELVKQIAERGGEMLQHDLVLSLNFSKAKVSRMLTNLEKRGLIMKEHYGLTNKVFLASKLRVEKN